MPLHSLIEFIPVTEPVTGLVTKFGGQPCWLDAPQWPLSRQTGKPMQFLCQIALDPRLYPGRDGDIAYIFMTCDEVDGTWKPEGGENAVIIQSSSEVPAVAVSAQATGPALFELDESGPEFKEVQREYRVRLTTVDDPLDADWSPDWDKDEESVTVWNKIGGHAQFIQNKAYPPGDGWRLLLQLDSTQVPFWVNFGDAGVAYTFLNAEGTAGRMLWQCA